MMVRPRTCLFVYGTLMSHVLDPLGHRERRLLYRDARLIGPARMRGTLYECHHCPAFVDGDVGQGDVFGEVFLLEHPKATFLWLDSFEAPDYVRVERAALLANGTREPAWVYVYRGKLHSAQTIASGRWTPRVRTPAQIQFVRDAAKGAGLTIRARPRTRCDLPR